MSWSTVPGGSTRILLADRHPIVREGLRSLLNQRLSAPAIREASTIQEVLAALEAGRADLLVSEVELDSAGGVELARQVRSRWPTVQVLLFSSLSDTVHAERGLAAGALGYVTKDESLDGVGDAVEAVLAGHLYVSSRVKRQFVQRLAPVHEAGSPLDRLTDRELDVFEHFGRGLTRREIASELNLSAKTVDSYRARIQQKLGLGSAAMLRRAAVQALSELAISPRDPALPAGGHAPPPAGDVRAASGVWIAGG